ERQTPELLAANDRGNAFMRQSPLAETRNAQRFALRKFALGRGGKRGLIESQRMTDQDACIELGRSESRIPKRRGERASGAVDRSGQRGRRRCHQWAPSCAARSAAWCSVMRASTISSSASPSITWGNL